MATALKESDKVYIRNYVAEAPDVLTKQARRRECADIFGLRLLQVAAITAHSVGKLAQKRQVDPSAMDLPAGVAMDYDNPAKRLYRQKFLGAGGFVDRNTIPSERPHQKVLCFPGRKCLEIPMWLELGYTPKNIVGCENESAAWPELCTNAARYGISIRTTDVVNVVDEQPWDAVHLDYCGPIGKEVLLHLSRLKLKPKAVYGQNLLAGRENESAQLLIDHFYSNMQGFQEFSKAATFVDALHVIDRLKKATLAAVEEGTQLSTDVELKDKRDQAILLGILRCVSMEHRHTFRTHPTPNLPPHLATNETIQRCLTWFFCGFWRVLVACGVNMDVDIEVSHRLLDLYDIAMNPSHILRVGEQWSYISPSRQKYLSDFYKLEVVKPYGMVTDEAIRFINDCIAAMAMHGMAAKEVEKNNEDMARNCMIYQFYFRFRTRNGMVRDVGGSYKPSQNDSIECFVGGCLAGTLKISSMNRAIVCLHTEMQKKNCLIRSRYQLVRKLLMPENQSPLKGEGS